MSKHLVARALIPRWTLGVWGSLFVLWERRWMIVFSRDGYVWFLGAGGGECLEHPPNNHISRQVCQTCLFPGLCLFHSDIPASNNHGSRQGGPLDDRVPKVLTPRRTGPLRQGTKSQMRQAHLQGLQTPCFVQMQWPRLELV